MEKTLPKKIQWVKAAFSREVLLKDNDQVIGKMTREVLSSDVIAELGNTRLLFDVRGFLKKKVEVKDLTTANAIIGTIEFSWGRMATLHLQTGEKYVWERKNIFMKEWGMIHDLPNTTNDPEEVHYKKLRHFFGDEGEIALAQDSPQLLIVLLSGLFVRNYFLRRRRQRGVLIDGS